MENGKEKKRQWFLPLLILILILLVLFSIITGRFAIPLEEFAGVIKEAVSGVGDQYEAAATVLFQSRLPRILAAVLIGCALAVSGASYQGIFRNPMVSPDLLGASAGAGFGAALGFLLGIPAIGVQFLSFGFGLVSVLLTCLISKKVSGGMDQSPILLVLSGIVVGALFQAFISIVKYVADPFDTMPSIAFWLMGGLTYVTAPDVLFLAVPVLAGTVILFLLRWRMNLLSLGADEAESLGVSVKRCRGIIIVCATFMTASSVAVGGMIGWAGLIVPHFARMFVGPDYKKMLPCAAVLGSVFLLLVDDAARCITAQDLPIGILTAMIGAPVFVALLAKGKRGFLS
ncbi:Probable ABC transporter permease protein HI_1471 [uncultured Roseburia sp.]|uniref:Iron ABC transporter permease n=1 Tax=Brotonthovivens ammoniilytica TaxID=2981725 RepID=A0ABT2TH63_9FIRM|nr:iron ABC transporter permease [Brotonthovivens ammoniilytica]MCU6761527.1 iron ABC transporter permease [Brotonthovivens ammoniilytica]SCI31013.1 Probable ABC transporter permease protein HI_1471 [uncultured Roseburia sp.]